MKILVSHECPICLLELSRSFNDFSYALVHLFETHPTYYNFFFQELLRGREVLLDNSIFELGKAFDPEQFKIWIEKLQPSAYIMPDALNDAQLTISQADSWKFIHGRDGHCARARRIGVVQGKTYQDLIDCYKYMDVHADQIAISFDYEYYQVTGTGKNHLEKNMTGRQKLIRDLIAEGIWNWRKPIHLLGCSLAREFSWYVNHNIWNIRSCDTSNPIIAGMELKKYDAEFGLNTKSSMKLADSMDILLDDDQREVIMENVAKFKTILHRD